MKDKDTGSNAHEEAEDHGKVSSIFGNISEKDEPDVAPEHNEEREQGRPAETVLESLFIIFCSAFFSQYSC